MKKEVYICDRCKKQTEITRLQRLLRVDNYLLSISGRDNIDLCLTCKKDFKEFMKQ